MQASSVLRTFNLQKRFIFNQHAYFNLGHFKLLDILVGYFELEFSGTLGI